MCGDVLYEQTRETLRARETYAYAIRDSRFFLRRIAIDRAFAAAGARGSAKRLTQPWTSVADS